MQYYHGVFGTTLSKSTNLTAKITVNPNFARLIPMSCPAFRDSCAGRAWERGYNFAIPLLPWQHVIR